MQVAYYKTKLRKKLRRKTANNIHFITPNRFKENDYAGLINDKEEYKKEGVTKGMKGYILSESAYLATKKGHRESVHFCGGECKM